MIQTRETMQRYLLEVDFRLENLVGNINAELDLNFEDINDSETLEQEQKDKANDASDEISRTKKSLIEDEYLDQLCKSMHNLSSLHLSDV